MTLTIHGWQVLLLLTIVIAFVNGMRVRAEWGREYINMFSDVLLMNAARYILAGWIGFALATWL